MAWVPEDGEEVNYLPILIIEGSSDGAATGVAHVGHPAAPDAAVIRDNYRLVSFLLNNWSLGSGSLCSEALDSLFPVSLFGRNLQERAFNENYGGFPSFTVVIFCSWS